MRNRLPVLVPAARLVAALLLATALATAQVELAAPFQDGMVLQRDRVVNVFGTAPAGVDVVVEAGSSRARTRSDAEGRFLAQLPAQAAGGPHRLVARHGDAVDTCDDVWFGEVWLASGQSNMEWQANRFDDLRDAVAEAADPELRLLLVERNTATEPLSTFEGTWRPADPEVVAGFSAVAWSFGRELRARLGVPVGIVASSWGGTRAEAWTRPAALSHDPVLTPILERWTEIDAAWPEASKRHEAALADWEKASAEAKEKGERAPRRPAAPLGPLDRHHPGALYHGMIAPLVPMTFRGVLWYQGESNADRAWQYGPLFQTMIRDWRDDFGQGDLPFLFVQLANFESGKLDGTTWGDLRDAQLQTLRTVPNTGMACTIDLGLSKNIHPPNKAQVAHRLLRWARTLCYGEDVVPSGPLYSHCRIEGNEVRLFFDHVGTGLAGPTKGGYTGFRIAGRDRVWHDADVRLDGETLLAQSGAVPHPVAVRYAWADDPAISLRNGEGLPASPFRTDAWPVVTQGAFRP